jgi:hypothetical protein
VNASDCSEMVTVLLSDFSDLLTTCYSPDGVPFTEIYGKHAKAEILNPILNKTYEIFKSFFNEIREVFPDEYIHLGMDEVYYDCWLSNPDISKFMQDKGFVNISQVEQYYVRRTLQNVRDLGYKYMTWQVSTSFDPLSNNAPTMLYYCLQDPVDNGVKVRACIALENLPLLLVLYPSSFTITTTSFSTHPHILSYCFV